VDDEETLAYLGKEVLESLGYDVVSRTNSAEALKLFEADPHQFDLIISDQTMPYMTGMVLAGKILEIRPEIPSSSAPATVRSYPERRLKKWASGLSS